MLKHRNKDKGFTLIEIIVTTTIIAMLAAFAVPTFIGYIETGNQTKRMNIAKTIYLAAQNQLTEKKINQTLGAFSMTEEVVDVDKNKDILPKEMPDDEKANIVYISKSQGGASGKVYELLDSVIQDKSVLNNAILIEYNKTTGFVLSVFYSEETGGSDEAKFNFTYEKPKDEDKTDKYKSISGTRPYEYADERRQGYCGIEETGMLPPTGKEVIINIKDGEKYPLKDGTGNSYENVLYAEALIPESMVASVKSIKLQILNQNGEPAKLLPGAEDSKTYETGSILLEKLQSPTIETALQNKAVNGNSIILKPVFDRNDKTLPTDGSTESYSKIIWVLDYVNGDMLSQNNSIGLKISPQNIRVGISGNGINMKSLSMQNSHFAYETQDKSIVGIEKSKSFITSARHLNNVRYKLDGDFRQLDDIDMKVNSKTEITNFLPIGLNPIRLSDTPVGKFTGKYFGRKSDGTYLIKNMKIDIKEVDNVGLFADIEGKALFGPYTEGIITGLTLENPSIEGGNYVGAVAGSNSGQISMVTVENNKQISGPIVQGTGAIGGIVGENNGVLSNIVFVNKGEEKEKVSLIKGSGFEVGGIVGRSSGKLNDIVVISSSSAPIVSGAESKELSYTGGIAGRNDTGEIDRVMYLAVAPKFGTEAEEKIAPIQGASSTGTRNNKSAIYLSGEAVRPTPIIEPMDNAYNVVEANFGTPMSTKEISKEIDWKNWKKNNDSDENNMLYIYPYWYQYETPYKDKINNWPVVNEEGGKAELVYYELYSDNTWGYSNSKTEPIKNDKDLEKVKTEENIHVINDGYLIEYPDNNNGNYTIEVINGVNEKLELKSDSWKWNDKLLTQDTQNLEPVRFTKNGKSYMRLFLKNSILESVAKEKNEIEVTVKKGKNAIMSPTAFNPLFAPQNTVEEAQKAESSGSFIIRSPRQLDNVDKVESKKETVALRVFSQDLNLDFEKYSRELKFENNKLSTDPGTKISTKRSIVAGKFADIYNGNNKYIRNVNVAVDVAGSGILNWEVDGTNIGLFAEVKGTVKNIALLKSSFKGKSIVGGIAGTLAVDTLANESRIENCELSEVIVENIETGLETGLGNATGGVVGKNEGILSNIYFNSTYHENGVYSTPIKSREINTVGGLVGNNTGGTIQNAYITAMGPLNNSEKINIIAGGEGKLENVYYLKVGDYNRNVSGNQGEAFNSDGSLVSDSRITLASKLGSPDWETASILTTKETVNCNKIAYPYPKLSGMNHYFDWPILVNTLKYFEKYSDGGFGYYFYNGGNIVDTLKYDNPDITVVDEGYIVEVLSIGKYDIKFNSLDKDKLTGIVSQVFHDKIAIRLNHSQVEKLITGSNITSDGIKPIKIEAFKYTGDKVDETTDILLNNANNANEANKAYFNPLFPKQIYYYADNEIVQYVKTLEIRSPRHMLNVEQVSNNIKKISINNITDYTKEKSGGSKTYLENIDTKFPYGNSMGTPTSTSTGVFSFENSYKDGNSYSNTMEFENPKEPYNGSEIITKTSSGNNIVTEVVDYYKVEKATQIYKIEGLDWRGRAYKDSAYWNLNSETEYRTDVKRITTITTKRADTIKFDLKQTISINFGGQYGETTIVNRPAYKWESGDGRSVITNNIISKLISDYDAGVYDKNQVPLLDEYGSITRNRIYNLVMNVTSTGSATFSENTGGAFGTVAEGVTVKNLEFVDPQIRYNENGRGGGIVTNTNLGIIDNVQVYNKEYTQSLFANSSGNTDTVFCHSGISSTNNYGHNHGGIAGQSAGLKAKITNCIVGTNANTADKIANNQTLITCYQNDRHDGEWATTRVGGIVGFVYGQSQVISCINIAKIDARWVDDTRKTSRKNSPYSLGGIAGATGLRGNTPAVSYISGYLKPSPGYIVGCYNAGTLTLKNGWVAGITGYPATRSEIISCYNTGRINVEGTGTQLTTIVPLDDQPLRIGGISGEPDNCTIKNCYNIGYVSKECLPTTGVKPDNSAAGAIMALPAYSNSTLENCYSLAADQFRPIGIVGKLYKSNPPSSVNGFNTNEQLVANFTTWQSRDNLRNNEELVSDTHINLFPAAENYWKYNRNEDKGYPVFKLEANSFYIYPQLKSFYYKDVTYSNPHITPWESIDSIYDATLIYYEKYYSQTSGTNDRGYYSVDIKGNPQDSLSNDKVVTQDGYFIQVARVEKEKIINNKIEKYTEKYNVQINDKNFGPFEPNSYTEFGGREGILFTQLMIDELGYDKIRVYTTTLNAEDNKMNRIIGTNTVLGSKKGNDIYFDSRFPKEIKYGTTESDDVELDRTTLKPPTEPYYIRSPRHIGNISKLIPDNLTNLTIERTFNQELDLDFASYGTDLSEPFAPIPNEVVHGDFAGIYNGGGKDIQGLKIIRKADSRSVGMFQNITSNATVGNFRLVNPRYDSKLDSGTGAGDIFNMGSVAAINNGTIQKIAVENPTFVFESGTNITKNIGGIAGTNSGNLKDSYLIISSAGASLMTSSTGASPMTDDIGTAKLGGITGTNSGTMKRVLYLAKAPLENPIAAENLISGKLEDVYFLSGSGYNQSHNNIGIPKATLEFKDIDINNWYDWSKKEGYPYLTSMPTEIMYPDVK